MRYHSQNLTSNDPNPSASIFWAGRTWLYAKRTIHWEWYFGRRARDFAVTASIGSGDGDDGLLLHLCIPFLFSFYVGMEGVRQCRGQHKTGIAIHDGSIWLYPFVKDWETVTADPWWKKAHAWNFPWQLDWWKTEILSHDLSRVEWSEDKTNRKPFMESFDERQEIQRRVSQDYGYAYTLKSGEVQKVKAAVYVDRMEHRARWWPVFRNRIVRTSISVNFSQEVGEGVQSWKGGCTGCGYEMLPGELPEQTLRRMERERKFGR